MEHKLISDVQSETFYSFSKNRNGQEKAIKVNGTKKKLTRLTGNRSETWLDLKGASLSSEDGQIFKNQ